MPFVPLPSGLGTGASFAFGLNHFALFGVRSASSLTTRMAFWLSSLAEGGKMTGFMGPEMMGGAGGGACWGVVGRFFLRDAERPMGCFWGVSGAISSLRVYCALS